MNDVSHALEKIIEIRKAENTWQIDSFGGLSAAPTRPPDEVDCIFCLILPSKIKALQAIVFCLDLSESMGWRSGVSRSSPKAGHREDVYDVLGESIKAVEKVTDHLSEQEILDTGDSGSFTSASVGG